MTNFNQRFSKATQAIIAAGAAGALTFALAACGATGASTSADTQMQGAAQTTEQNSAANSNSATSDGGITSDSSNGDGLEVVDDTSQENGDSDSTASVDIASFSIDPSALFSKRDLDASYDKNTATVVTLSDQGSKASGSGVTIDGSTVTVSSEGTYVLSGTLSNGRVVVDAADDQKVQLVLDGASVTSSTGTALYVKSADKVFITLAGNSNNTLAANGAATEEDGHSLDGTVFAADDLTVNGDGSLGITSANGHGVVGKDELTLVSGNLTVTAAGSAIQGKDSVAVKDGTYTLKATTDGIHADHDSNGAKGFVYIAGGTFSIEAGSDGIDATNDIMVDGGTINVSAADDGIHSEYDLTINNGTIRVPQSYESLEGSTITINGGDIDVTASDDGLNATGVPSSTNTDDVSQDVRQMQQQPEGEMPQMPDGGQMPQMPDGGQMPQMPDGGQMLQMPDGGQMPQQPEGAMPQMPSGEVPAMPDGQNPGMNGEQMLESNGGQTDAMPQGEFGGRRGGMGNGDGAGNQFMNGGDFENDPTASIAINGGKLVVTAGGDAIDSNGALTVSGGETYVNGPTSNGDGPIDCAGEATVTGGTMIAVGSAGMATGFGANSTQGSMLVSATGSAGDLIEVKDATGKVLASFTAGKSYECIIASAPGMTQGGTYTLAYGSQTLDVTLDSIAYSNVTAGFGGMGGMGGFRK